MSSALYNYKIWSDQISAPFVRLVEMLGLISHLVEKRKKRNAYICYFSKELESC